MSYDGLSFRGHLIAGALAGMGEHLIMFPVDTIKTRMQALSHPGQQLHSTLLQAMSAVLRREGLAGFYRGATAVAIGAGPSHALYFASYEAAKNFYTGNQGGHQPVSVAAAGITATVINDFCMTPWDVIKQRMQVSNSPYHTVRHCVTATWKNEGPVAFFRSYWTTLLMNVPYTAIHFSTYESAKILLGEQESNDSEESLSTQLLAGGLAGGLAAAATTPFDVIKTRLQLEGVGSATRYNTMSVLPIMQKIWRDEGGWMLMRGWQPRVLFHIPSAAICWGVYESCKRYLNFTDM